MTDELKALQERSELVVEIVELENGDVALRKAGLDDGSGEPLLKISVADHLKEQMKGQYVDVARIMLTAGVQLIADAGFMSEEIVADTDVQPTVH